VASCPAVKRCPAITQKIVLLPVSASVRNVIPRKNVRVSGRLTARGHGVKDPRHYVISGNAVYRDKVTEAQAQ